MPGGSRALLIARASVSAIATTGAETFRFFAEQDSARQPEIALQAFSGAASCWTFFVQSKIFPVKQTSCQMLVYGQILVGIPLPTPSGKQRFGAVGSLRSRHGLTHLAAIL